MSPRTAGIATTGPLPDLLHSPVNLLLHFGIGGCLLAGTGSIGSRSPCVSGGTGYGWREHADQETSAQHPNSHR